MRAPINEVTLPYQLKVLPGGHFSPGNQYGFISWIQFCKVGIIMIEDEENNSSSESSLITSDIYETINEDINKSTGVYDKIN